MTKQFIVAIIKLAITFVGINIFFILLFAAMTYTGTIIVNDCVNPDMVECVMELENSL